MCHYYPEIADNENDSCSSHILEEEEEVILYNDRLMLHVRRSSNNSNDTDSQYFVSPIASNSISGSEERFDAVPIPSTDPVT